jgi:hypothetical protein
MAKEPVVAEGEVCLRADAGNRWLGAQMTVFGPAADSLTPDILRAAWVGGPRELIRGALASPGGRAQRLGSPDGDRH